MNDLAELIETLESNGIQFEIINNNDGTVSVIYKTKLSDNEGRAYGLCKIIVEHEAKRVVHEKT